jgi:myo-inositol-1(or 4)-monophosphatase
MMMKTDYLERLCEQACTIVGATGDWIQQKSGQVTSAQVEEKSLNSLVSYVDKTAEEQLVRGLGALLPEAGFLTEEGTVATTAAEYQWVIDPLDGTTNFLHGLPLYCVSVGLRRGTDTLIGIIYAPAMGEMFYAWKGGGAWLNGDRIFTSAQTSLAKSLLVMGFPYYDYGRMEAFLEVLKTLMPKVRGVRRLGSAAIDLAWVAMGRFEAFFEYGLNAWDVAAGILLVEEAGGKLSDFKGGNEYFSGKEIVAAAPGIREELLSHILIY